MNLLKYSTVALMLIIVGCESRSLTDKLSLRPEAVRLKSSLEHPYGVNNLVSHQHSFDRERQLLLAMMGIGRDRVVFAWDRIQPLPVNHEWADIDMMLDRARSSNLAVLPVLYRSPEWAGGPAAQRNVHARIPNRIHWERFVREVVGRYRDRITFWEIWDRPDSFDHFEGIPNDYIEVLKIAHEAARQANPDCAIVMGSVANPSWLDTALAFGAASYCDVIALQLTPQAGTIVPTRVASDAGAAAPEVGTTDDAAPVKPVAVLSFDEQQAYRNAVKQLDRFMAVLAKHKVNKPVWLTSVGEQAAPAEAQARLLVKVFAAARARGIDCIYWNRLISEQDGNVASGLLYTNLERRPAAEAYSTLTRILSRARRLRTLSDDPEAVSAFQFTGPSETITIAWSPEEVKFSLPKGFIRAHDIYGKEIELSEEELAEGVMPIDNEPVYIVSEKITHEPPRGAMRRDR